MPLSHRIFLAYFILVSLAGLFLLLSVKDTLRPAVRQSMEDTLVDTANILAEIVEQEVASRDILQGNIAGAVQDYMTRKPKATIWGLHKNKTSLHIYITDHQGFVIYDSRGNDVGVDYSAWNDVYLTLQGKYGARSTRTDPNNSNTSTMYVAAPIYDNATIIGVLSVGKPTISIVPFMELSERNIMRAALILLIAALILGWFIAWYLGRSSRKLADYARCISNGKDAALPVISDYELSQLASAMDSMRTSLEGKEYVERYVHALTHEIKSPLSGIRGACELLDEQMNQKDRHRFIHNIKDDASRIQIIIDRLLELAMLEQQRSLKNPQLVNVRDIVNEVVLGHISQLKHKSIKITVDIDANNFVCGDPFFIRQALTNILDNAIDFSPERGHVAIAGKQMQDTYIVECQDEGAGIPKYAQDKVFERFYSLPRPDSGKKSSGLGLSFVREVMSLHKGTVDIYSSDDGCCVSLHFPKP